MTQHQQQLCPITERPAASATTPGISRPAVEYQPARSDHTTCAGHAACTGPGRAPPAHELVGLVQLVREHEDARRAALRAGGVVAHVEQDCAHRAQRVALAHRAARACALRSSARSLRARRAPRGPPERPLMARRFCPHLKMRGGHDVEDTLAATRLQGASMEAVQGDSSSHPDYWHAGQGRGLEAGVPHVKAQSAQNLWPHSSPMGLYMTSCAAAAASASDGRCLC